MRQTITIKRTHTSTACCRTCTSAVSACASTRSIRTAANEELLNIAKYNYNWQLDYQLNEPKCMPAGTKVTAVAAFDNSTQNKANPDPARKVPWGQQSWDEMFFGAVTYKFVDQSDAQLSSAD